MTLYRIDHERATSEDVHHWLMDELLVPVVPCEHGNYDGHDTEYDPIKDRALDGHWCPGAAVGETDHEPKMNPNPKPGIMHDFYCTHKPCRCAAVKEDT